MRFVRNLRWLAIFAAAMLCSAPWSTSRLRAEDLNEWVITQQPAAQRKLLGAIGRNGSVIASPDESTPNQNYYFHWIRDGALTMDAVVTFFQTAPDLEDRQEYDLILRQYVAFSRINQTAPQPAGFMGLGEPKFYVTGTVFTDDWGKPQNDGPALRTITLSRWAHLLLDATPSDPFVLHQIKAILIDDLAFVRAHWRDKCKDLWEEVRGNHFYTRMAQRRALIDGATLLTRIGDTTTAGLCTAEVAALETEITSHFDATRNYIIVTRDVEGNDKGKSSGLDAAVMLGVLHAETTAAPFFSPIDDRVLATAMALRSNFAGLYPINDSHHSTDPDGELMEAAIGRYPEDKYNGASDDEGNPWFLTTAAFAEHAYRARATWIAKHSINVTSLNLAYLTAARNAGGSAASLTPGTAIPDTDGRFTAIANGLRTLGDRYLRRIRRHAAVDGTLSEQFKRGNGFMTGAVNLTWSYAALLTAISRR